MSRSDALVRDQHESPMVAARRRARPVRMQGGRRCPPRVVRNFLLTMIRTFHEPRLAVAGYLLSSSRLGGRLFVRRLCIGGGRDWECRSHAACPYVAASERQDSVRARAISPTASQPGSICQRLRPDMLAPTAIIRRTPSIWQEFPLRVRLNYVRCPFPVSDVPR